MDGTLSLSLCRYLGLNLYLEILAIYYSPTYRISIRILSLYLVQLLYQFDWCPTVVLDSSCPYL